MGQTLTHGVYLPDEGERNCYSGLAGNWTILDGAVGTVAEHTSQIAGKAPAVHTHTKADITDFPVYGTTAGTICEGNDSRLSDARTPVSHSHGSISNDGKLANGNKVVITNSNKVITESSVTDTELGYLSGVTSSVQTQLNAKAANSDVVHKTGNETIDGNKKFSLAIELLNGRIYRDAASLAKGTLPSERTYYGITNDFALDSSDSSHRINQCRCWVEANGNNVMEWNLSAWNTTNLATLRLSVYQVIHISEEDLLKGQYRLEITQLKKALSDTDYKAIKYAEGQISEDEYSKIKSERQGYRDRINYLEGLM